MITVFVYIFKFWGITLLDAPYKYKPQPPEFVALGEPCNEPKTKLNINTVPSIGDTVFVNRVGSGGGVWVVLKEGNLQ